MASKGPSSPPRLPSPPPFPEIQIGPKSPSLGALSDIINQAMDPQLLEKNARRRIHPGTKAADMATGPPLMPFQELGDSAFKLQEHLKALHYHHTKPLDADHTIPINRETATIIATPPEGVYPSLWLYELCRFLINKCNDLIVGFLFDDPACSSGTCPEMRASEWQFLCAVHEQPKSCCAIDYCCHTLDWATNIVTSQKNFPNGLIFEAGGDPGEKREAGRKHLVNIFRRLHRIFAHAWFQHRGVFWQVEGQTGLYVLFKTVCDTHHVLPPENFKLPPEAEGLEQIPEPKQIVPSILRSENSSSTNHAAPETITTPDMYVSLGRTSTKRHIRSSPSTGSAVTTVLETDEVEEDKLDDMFFGHIPLPKMSEPETETEPEPVLEPELEPQPTSGADSTLERESVPEPESEPEEAQEVSEEQEQEDKEEQLQGEEKEEQKEEEQEEEEQEDAPKLKDAKTLPLVQTSSENAEEKIGEGNEAAEDEAAGEEKATETKVEEQEPYNSDDDAELEAFEEVPTPQIQVEPATPVLEREETAKPLKLGDEEVHSESHDEPKEDSHDEAHDEAHDEGEERGAEAKENVTIEEVPDDEEKPDSEVL